MSDPKSNAHAPQNPTNPHKSPDHQINHPPAMGDNDGGKDNDGQKPINPDQKLPKGGIQPGVPGHNGQNTQGGDVSKQVNTGKGDRGKGDKKSSDLDE